jgi:hypothetical protein
VQPVPRLSAAVFLASPFPQEPPVRQSPAPPTSDVSDGYNPAPPEQRLIVGRVVNRGKILCRTHRKSVKQRERIVRQTPESGPIFNRDLDWTLHANEITDSGPVVKTKLNNEKGAAP